MSQVLLKRGLKINLPASATLGEAMFTTDSKELFVGTGTGIAQITDIVYAESAPADTTKLWVDMINNVIKRYSGGEWVTLSAAAAATTFAALTGAVSDNSALVAEFALKADVTALNSEITSRTAAELVLTNAIAAEETARVSAVAGVQGALDAETTARQAAELVLTNAIAAETTARTDAFTNLIGTAPANLDTLQEIAAQITADGSVVGGLVTAISDKASIVALDAEITARTSADATLTSAIAAETTARTSADATLQSAIDAEVTARQAAISAIPVYTASNGVEKTGNDFALASTVAGSGLALTAGVLSIDVIDGGTF